MKYTSDGTATVLYAMPEEFQKNTKPVAGIAADIIPLDEIGRENRPFYKIDVSVYQKSDHFVNSKQRPKRKVAPMAWFLFYN